MSAEQGGGQSQVGSHCREETWPGESPCDRGGAQGQGSHVNPFGETDMTENITFLQATHAGNKKDLYIIFLESLI